MLGAYNCYVDHKYTCLHHIVASFRYNTIRCIISIRASHIYFKITFIVTINRGKQTLLYAMCHLYLMKSTLKECKWHIKNASGTWHIKVFILRSPAWILGQGNLRLHRVIMLHWAKKKGKKKQENLGSFLQFLHSPSHCAVFPILI